MAAFGSMDSDHREVFSLIESLSESEILSVFRDRPNLQGEDAVVYCLFSLMKEAEGSLEEKLRNILWAFFYKRSNQREGFTGNCVKLNRQGRSIDYYSEAVLAIFEDLSRYYFKSVLQFDALIFTKMVFLKKNFFRSRESKVENSVDIDQRVPHQEDVIDAVLKSEEKVLLSRALIQLAPNEKALYLDICNGKPYKELEQIYGQSIESLRQRKHRILEKLIDIIDNILTH